MKNIIEKYISLNNTEFGRYNSWNHCFEAFENNDLDNDTLALHLGFYLASWGMYRGSSGLLQKDYKIHTSAVKIIKDNYSLKCSKQNEVTISHLPEILKIVKELRKHYKSYNFETLKGKKKRISPTDTLISKILLGTLGCVPAFDRFFIDGVNHELLKDKQFKSLKRPSLEKLFDFVDNNEDLIKIQNEHPAYSKMKLVDMYFWQIGFDNYDPNKD